MMYSDEEAREFKRELYKKDLKSICWDILGLRELWDAGHDDLIKFIELNEGKNKFLFLAPRETFKSTILTIGKCIQEILRDSDTTILLASDTTTNAESFLSVIKKILETNKELKSLFGKFESDKWNESEITIRQRKLVSKTPTVSCAGSDRTTTSQHYKVIFCDDMVNRKTVNTLEQLNNTENFFSDVADLLEKQTGKLYIVGTRWDEGDYYGKIIDKRSDDYAIFNKMATDDGTINGGLYYPKKLSREVLRQLLIDKGSRDFYLQYMNTVTSSDTQIFKPPVREWHSLPKEMFLCITVDPAISKRKDSCDAVVMVSGLSRNGQIFILDYKAFSESEKHPKNIIDKIVEYHIKYNARVVGIESNGYQEALCMLLQDKADELKFILDIVPIHNNEDKARRIICLQPFWENGNILLKSGMVELAGQFASFRKPIVSKCDIIDTLSMRLTIPKEYCTYNVSKQRENNLIYAHPRDLQAYNSMIKTNIKNPYEGKAMTEQEFLERQRQFA